MVTCYAGHGLICDEALALSQVGDLVRHAIVLGRFSRDRFVVFIKRLTGAVGEGGSQVFHRIAMALRANFDLSFTLEFVGLDDVLAGLGLRISRWN